MTEKPLLINANIVLVAVDLPVYKYSSDIFHKEKNVYL